MLPRANSALRRAVRGSLFDVGHYAEFFEHLRSVGTKLRGGPGDVAGGPGEKADGVEMLQIVEHRCRCLQRGRNLQLAEQLQPLGATVRVDRGPPRGSNMAPLACSTNVNDAMVSNIATSTS
jgi:hypothetical protein